MKFSEKFESLRRINHIRRYSSYPVLRQENVAEHSFWCSFYAYTIGLEINQKNKTEIVNIGILLEKAMLHDLEESQTGDMIRTFKYADEVARERLKIVEKGLLKKALLFHEEVGEHIMKSWESSKDETIEGKIVSFSDLICVYLYCFDEIKIGNSFMFSVLKEAMIHLRKHEQNELLQPYCLELDREIKEMLMQQHILY